LACWGWIIRIVVTIALLVLTYVVPSTSTLVDTQGKYPQQVAVLSSLDQTTSAALTKNPTDTAALSTALGEVAKEQTGSAAEGTRVSALVTKHATPLKTLLALDDATAAALTKNPTDPAALPKALGEVAKSQGASAAKQAQVQQIATDRIQQLTTASAIDPTTLAALSGGSTAPALIAKAQGEIAKALNISSSAALTRLLGLASPAVKSDLGIITPYANALQSANAAIPAADLATINKYGNVLKSAQAGVPAATLAKLQKASKDTPHQWQHWWWVCFIAQIVFLPFVFLLTGRWSPKKAREDEAEHEAMVERELAELHQHAQA
jgi:hypothetical protein